MGDDVELNPPTRRRCTRCGREDVWDEAAVGWRVRTEGGQKRSGERFCLHEWDITGTHPPIRRRPATG